MGQQYTIKDVRRALSHLERVAHEARVLPRGKTLVVEPGSQTYGRPYRLYQRSVDIAHDPNGGGLWPTQFADSNIGGTASEACRTLHAVQMAIYAVLEANDDDESRTIDVAV